MDLIASLDEKYIKDASNTYDNNDTVIRLLEFTHDLDDPFYGIDTDNIVIGIVLSKIILKGFLAKEEAIHPYSELPFFFSKEDLVRKAENIRKYPLYDKQELRTYLIQDHCSCCT